MFLDGPIDAWIVANMNRMVGYIGRVGTYYDESRAGQDVHNRL
jgi:hypothetical protein